MFVFPSGVLAAILSLYFISTIVDAKRVQFQDCGPDSNIKCIEVAGCAVQPCRVHIHTNVTITAFIKLTQNSSRMFTEIRGFINGRQFGLPEPAVNACTSGSLSPQCPVVAGQIYRHTHTLRVHEFYPTVPTTLQYLVKGDNEAVLACARIYVLISDPR